MMVAMTVTTGAMASAADECAARGNRGVFVGTPRHAHHPRRRCLVTATTANAGNMMRATRTSSASKSSVYLQRRRLLGGTTRTSPSPSLSSPSPSTSSPVVCNAKNSPDDDAALKADARRLLELLKAPDRAFPKESASAGDGGGDDDDDEADEKREGFAALRLFDLDTVRQRWDVPWGGWRVFLGIGGWSLSFVLTAAVIFPVFLVVNGYDPRAFNPSEKSEYLLLIQAVETLETFFVLWLLLRKFQPELDDEWFNVDPRGDAFSIEKGWATWGLIGYVMVFLSIAVTGTVMDAGTHAWEAMQHVQQAGGGAGAGAGMGMEMGGGGGGLEQAAATAAGAGAAGAGAGAGAAASSKGPGTIDAVLPLLGGGEDQATRFLSILAVTSVLAPALEEVVFRGFLLASLTKWLPTPGAVLFSSVIFAGAHLAPRDFPQLCVLGMVLGFSYARTRNLLTPMMIHSLWNSGVLVVVAVLVSTGNTDMLPGM